MPATLIITLDDPNDDPEFEVSLERLVSDVSERGVNIYSKVNTPELHKLLHRSHYGYHPLDELRTIFVDLAPTIKPVLATSLGTWLQAPRGRKMRLKYRGQEVEAQTTEQIETMLERVMELRRKPKERAEGSKPKKASRTQTRRAKRAPARPRTGR
jgi:hypothetical protein